MIDTSSLLRLEALAFRGVISLVYEQTWDLNPLHPLTWDLPRFHSL